ncbi:MAG: GNAT family N-acetyltransferase, partial [Chloroflexota bacterium]
QVIDRLPDEARVVAELRTPFVDFDALLEKRGFAVHHTHSRKRIDFDDRPPPASFPAGYQIVTMREHPHLIDFIRVYRTAFRTMRGFVEDALENRVARWQKDIDMHGDYFDPSYFVLVRDEQDNDAAVLMAWTTSRENSEEAWISIVGTLPEYRRQGLARNLLYHAFNRFYEDGKKAAALTVDDASLTGANDLYSKVGMRTVQTIRVYARELRAGVEYSVQA